MSDLHGIAFSSYVTSITFAVLDTLAVLLRLSLRTHDAIVGLEDAVLTVGWAGTMTYIGLTSAATLASHGTLDPTDPDFSKEGAKTFEKLAYISVPVFFLGISCIKLSILTLYRRIFSHKSFRRIVDVVAIVCVLWCIAAFVAAWLFCVPMAHFWDPTGVPGECFNFGIYFLCLTIFETVLDTVIIAMPFFPISRLQLSTKKKYGLFGIFSLGILVIVSNICRIVFLYQPGNWSLNQSKTQLWTVIHMSTAIFCACTMTYKPLFRHMRMADFTLSGYRLRIFSSASFRRWSKTSDTASAEATAANGSLHKAEKGPHDLVTVSTQDGNDQEPGEAIVPDDRIQVDHAWTVERTAEV